MKQLIIILLVSSGTILPYQKDPFLAARQEMVTSQIEARGISDPATLQAMRKVPRHLFVPPSQVHEAYSDRPLPIGYNQTISQPLIVAYMTQLAKPAKGKKHLK